MIRKFSVKNYKNFKNELTIDFTHVHDYQYNESCVKNGLINKMIVYGKNAVGKSNLGYALYDIFYNALSAISYPNSDRFLYKNADANSDELIEFNYSFLIDSHIVDYTYCKKDIADFVIEKFSIDGELVFEYNLIDGTSNFSNVSVINASDLNWEEYINTATKKSETIDEETGKPTALRYIIHNTVQNEETIIYKLSQFIKGMRFSSSPQSRSLRLFPSPKFLLDEERLKDFQKFLNEYGVECELILLEKPDGEKDIYFNHRKPLNFFSNMSSGTAELTQFYLKYFSANNPTFIFIDEFDAYYHFELSEKIVELLEKRFDCQVILTSHNTNLLSNSIMRPDCFMILSNGKLAPICEATNRELRYGHNLEKLYMNGEFDEE